jgi:hypothetical protein
MPRLLRQGRKGPREFSDQGGAQPGIAAATILDEVQHQVAQAVQVRAVDDRAAMPFTGSQSCPRQNSQMRRHGVLRNVELAGDFTSRQAVRLVTHQEAERLEASGLRKGREGRRGRS